ncbi:MAG: transposase [Gammaproteobacteria bacterium AqS3]|nr:transposase [Gammaproteobacteria bacterium AqS3]
MGLGEYLHETVAHSVSGYVPGMAHTNGIESFWALLKRGHNGIYHSMSRDHLQRYVDEFAGRYNMCRQTTMFKIDIVFSGLAGKRLTYGQLTIRRRI